MSEALASWTETLEPVTRLSRDLRKGAATMSPAECRYIVDLYYQLQENRIRAAHQKRQAVAHQEPHDLTVWVGQQFDAVERQIPPVMRIWAEAHKPGQWALSIHGVGPVIAAGLLAHIDIERAPTAGHIWSFAGLNPTQEWKKGGKRPFNARLKVLCWKIGQSFMKLRANEKDVYGAVYEQRKAFELARDAEGYNNGVVVKKAGKTHTVGEDLESLPPFLIDARARRYAVKLFLSHLHHVMYECHYGEPPPKPYILTQGDHAHFTAPPNWPMAAE